MIFRSPPSSSPFPPASINTLKKTRFFTACAKPAGAESKNENSPFWVRTGAPDVRVPARDSALATVDMLAAAGLLCGHFFTKKKTRRLRFADLELKCWSRWRRTNVWQLATSSSFVTLSWCQKGEALCTVKIFWHFQGLDWFLSTFKQECTQSKTKV